MHVPVNQLDHFKTGGYSPGFSQVVLLHFLFNRTSNDKLMYYWLWNRNVKDVYKATPNKLDNI